MRVVFILVQVQNVKAWVNVSFQIGSTLETVASQDWVREKCSRNRNLLLDNDMLGDHALSTNSQARYLLHLLNPYCSSETSADPAQLARMDSSAAMEHILKVLLHIGLNVNLYTKLSLPHIIHVYTHSIWTSGLWTMLSCTSISVFSSHRPPPTASWITSPRRLFRFLRTPVGTSGLDRQLSAVWRVGMDHIGIMTLVLHIVLKAGCLRD